MRNWFRLQLIRLGLVPSEVLVVKSEWGFVQHLDDLARRSECSRAEVIRRAIGLYAHALSEAKEGRLPVFIPEGKQDVPPRRNEQLRTSLDGIR